VVAHLTAHPSAGKGVVYVRVSGTPYGPDPFSPENQRRICQDCASGEKADIVIEFADLAVSGREEDAKRPGFEAALGLLRGRKVETLYVATLDRFSRRGVHHVNEVLDRVEEVGGRIVFVADGLDTRQPGARREIAQLAEQAKAEADAGSWRLGQWHAHNRRSGLWKRIRPYGYVVNNGKLHPHPIEGPIVRSIVDRYLAGASLRSIAKSLNVQHVKPPRLVFYEEALAKGYMARKPAADSWSYVAVRGILTAPALAALISHKGQVCHDLQGEPICAGKGIVTPEERARILAEIKRRGAIQGTRRLTGVDGFSGIHHSPKYLLTGFGRCGECGKALQRIETSRGGVYYRCARKGQGQICRGGIISGTFLEAEVTRRCAERLRSLAQSDPVRARDADQLSPQTWKHLPLAEKRAILGRAIWEVWVYSADVPVNRRVHLVWTGESRPVPSARSRSRA
jgi:site-specific DNA recombinase